MPSPIERLRTALADRYDIEREIGQGGMATVYVARDIRHKRPVAVKVLREDLAAVLGAERFLREIEIAANLTHPHILPLHDSGEAAGFLYYVMPFIEGDTLRQRLDREGELPIAAAVSVLREVADALAFAHARGVIHRDIKPDNVMLQGRHAMVTDFGVAKAVSEATGGTAITTAGVALGTPRYMAPEQATADPLVDHRADIYALGVLAYEILAGRPPFQGASSQAVLAAQVTEQPEPLSKHRDQVSAELESLVMKCLAKKPADRWQRADDMLPALEAMAASSGGTTPTATRSLESPGGGRRRLWVVAGAAVAVSALVLLGAMLLRDEPLVITTSNIRQVTTDPGLEFQPSLSPDGDEVAYVVGPIESPRVVVRSAVDVASGGASTPTEGVPGMHWIPNWTPDGASIRYAVCTARRECEWKQVGKLGGPSTTLGLLSQGDITTTWSADGNAVAFARGDSIFAYRVGDTQPRLLGVHDVIGSHHSFAWSPDGRWLAYVDGNQLWRFSGNLSGSSIWIIAAEGGEPIGITSPDHLNVSPQWLPDSRHLLFVSERDGPRGIYLVEVGRDGPRGEVRSVAASTDPHSISLSADGTRLAYAKLQLRQNIWSIPIRHGEVLSVRQAEPVTQGNQVIETHDLSADGRHLTYDGSRLGTVDIYRVPVAGGPAQLVADLPGDAFEPAWSPDGTEIAFDVGLTPTNSAILVVPAEGGEPKVLVDFPSLDGNPAWSPDGNTIAFSSWGPEGGSAWGLWTISRSAVGAPWQQPEPFSDLQCFDHDWAPDGGTILCHTASGFAILSLDGDVLALLHPGSNARAPHFSADGTRVYYLRGPPDEPGIYSLSLAGGGPVKLVAFDDPTRSVLAGPIIHALSVAPDRFYLTISQYESDIWVMDLEY